MFGHNLKLQEHCYQASGQVVAIYIASIVCTIFRQVQRNNCLRVCHLFSYRNKIIFTENIYIQVPVHLVIKVWPIFKESFISVSSV